MIELADQGQIRSFNEHIAFFTDDKETPFEIIKITTNRVVTPFTVYVKNIATFDIANIEFFIPTGFTLINGKTPTMLKKGEGFFLELEVDSSKSYERFIQVEAKPHDISFE